MVTQQRSHRSIPWPVGSILAGMAGTAALTLAYAIEHRFRSNVRGALDYDDSLVPGEIVANVLHLGAVSARADAELGTVLRWGYGSAFPYGMASCVAGFQSHGRASRSVRP
jgi:hypothetical protein